ncbi:hypothetical protein BDR26DRAFT_865549 [Obelidium mucronatum]|nr:hypothetical protein BDR26DRAFT_865549 [Obelidium mucronatum]
MSFALIQESKKLSPNCSIEYIIHDSLDLPVLHSQQNEEHAPFYDISFAAYLFCLASTEEELVQMLESIYKNLKPGGLFVTVTDNIFDSSAMYSDDTASLGIVKESNKIRRDGDEVIVKFMQQQDNNQQCHQEHTEYEPHIPNSVESERHQYTELCRVTNYWLSPAAYERAFKKAGFSHWEWIEMPTTGIEEFDRNPPITLLKLIK